MRTLDFDVCGQKMRQSPKSDFSGIIKGTKKYLRCKFVLSTEWSGCKIVAVFWHYDSEIEAVPVLNGTCDVPDSVTDFSEFEVSIVGGKGKYRITTNRVKVEQGV